MKLKYISYGHAVDTCNRFQHLVGQPFDKEGDRSGIVQLVLIAPYSRILQWQYLRNIYSGLDYKEALNICKDNKYDVLIISSNFKPGRQSILPKPLRDYVEEFSLQTMS